MRYQKPSFLFKRPGQPGIYDFEQVRNLNVNRNTMLEVIEVERQSFSRKVGYMNLASVLAKFK